MNKIGWTEKQSLIFLFPLIISISFAMDVFVPSIPLMSQFFHVNNKTMQASLYVFMFTVALGQLIVGPLADYYGRRRIAIVASFLFLAGSFASCFAYSIHTLILARIIQAAGACGTYLISYIIVRDNFKTITCARLFSFLAGINALVASSAPIIGGILVDVTNDWRSNFYFLSFIGLLMSFSAYYNIPNYTFSNSKKDFELINAAKQILANDNFCQYSLIASISLLGLYLFCALSPEILITKLNLSGTEYGLWFGLNALTVFITNVIAVRLTYQYSLSKIIFTGLIWIIISCFIMLVLTYNNTSVLNFMLPMLSITIGIGLTLGNAAALSLKDFKEQAGMATSILGACQFGLAGFMGMLTAQWNSTPTLLAFPMLVLSLYALKKWLSQTYGFFGNRKYEL